MSITKQTPGTQSVGKRRTLTSKPYLALVPWLLFGLVTRSDSLTAACVVGLAAAIAVSVPALLAGRPKVLELATIGAFIAFTAIAIATDPSQTSWLYRYARAIATAALSVIAFASLLWVPFTEQYAREGTPPDVWDTPSFRHVNRVFTAMWGALFAAMAVSHVIAGAINTSRGQTIFNWVIPIVLLVQMIKFMDRYRQSHLPAHPL